MYLILLLEKHYRISNFVEKLPKGRCHVATFNTCNKKSDKVLLSCINDLVQYPSSYTYIDYMTNLHQVMK